MKGLELCFLFLQYVCLSGIVMKYQWGVCERDVITAGLHLPSLFMVTQSLGFSFCTLVIIILLFYLFLYHTINSRLYRSISSYSWRAHLFAAWKKGIPIIVGYFLYEVSTIGKRQSIDSLQIVRFAFRTSLCSQWVIVIAILSWTNGRSLPRELCIHKAILCCQYAFWCWVTIPPSNSGANMTAKLSGTWLRSLSTYRCRYSCCIITKSLWVLIYYRYFCSSGLFYSRKV